MIVTLLALLLQALPDNPVAEAARSLGTSGFKDGPPPATSPTAFKPDGKRRILARYAKQVGEDDAQRKALEEACAKILSGYEPTAKQVGAENDAAGALAFAVAVLYAGAKGSDLDDQAFLALIGRLRASLDVPAVREASDALKQEFYEWSLSCTALVLTVASAAETPAAKAELAKLAKAQLENLLGPGVDRLVLKGKDVSLKPAPPAVALTFTMPEGWVTEGIWHIKRERDPNDSATRAAMVRFPPSIEAGKDMGLALGELWKTSVPAELAGRHSSMVYRRYVGDGLFAQFVSGAGLEKGRVADTLFTIYLVDLGARWQPVVVAQTYEDPGFNIQSAVRMSAGFSYSKTAETAEVFLATLRGPGPKRPPIATKEALAGDYSFGTSTQLQWENVYTGATSMTVVNYGGTLYLKPDGKYTSTFQSASGQVGALKFGSEKGEGTWEIDGDQLVLAATVGFSRKYRIAGLTVFGTGEKVAVLLLRSDLIPSGAYAGDRSDWYSTKRP